MENTFRSADSYPEFLAQMKPETRAEWNRWVNLRAETAQAVGLFVMQYTQLELTIRAIVCSAVFGQNAMIASDYYENKKKPTFDIVAEAKRSIEESRADLVINEDEFKHFFDWYEAFLYLSNKRNVVSHGIWCFDHGTNGYSACIRDERVDSTEELFSLTEIADRLMQALFGSVGLILGKLPTKALSQKMAR